MRRVPTDEKTTVAQYSAKTGRVVLAFILAAGVACCSGYGVQREGSVAVSNGGLPMVAMDALSSHPDQRVLALRADSHTNVSYTVMRTSVSELIDSSPAWRAAAVSGQQDDTEQSLGQLAARLLSNADGESVASLVQLGFIGIFVVQGSFDDQLLTNVAACDGAQSVVTNATGTYYRLNAAQNSDVSLNTERQRAAQSSVWRVAWLVALAAVCLLYVLVAIPRGRKEDMQS